MIGDLGNLRITPADAGKTFVFSSWRQQQQDHPRGCGENSSGQRKRFIYDGITPADAGKTSIGF